MRVAHWCTEKDVKKFFESCGFGRGHEWSIFVPLIKKWQLNSHLNSFVLNEEPLKGTEGIRQSPDTERSLKQGSLAWKCCKCSPDGDQIPNLFKEEGYAQLCRH